MPDIPIRIPKIILPLLLGWLLGASAVSAAPSEAPQTPSLQAVDSATELHTEAEHKTESSGLHIASTLGLLLGACLLGGMLGELIRLPKVTTYLIVGLLLGPSVDVIGWLLGPGVNNVVPLDHVHAFENMLKLAMALVLFNLGAQFPLSRIRRVFPKAAAMSAGELLAVFLLVTLGLWLCGQTFSVALLLGCLALATAPATTVLVLRELKAKGPLTEFAEVMVAVNNFACIVAFEVVFLAIQTVQGSEQSTLLQAGLLARDIFGAALVGVAAGLLVSFGCGLMRTNRWLVMLVAINTFLLGICESWDIPYMLTFLVMGAVVANTSSITHKISEEQEHVTGLLAVLFFAVHGAELNLNAFFAVGLAGSVYITCRIAGKLLGVFAAARFTQQSPAVQHWLGSALLAQAGAAIALASITMHRDPELGKIVQPIVLGSVVLFEILGSLTLRLAVVRAGEAPIGQVVRHTSGTWWEQARELWDRWVLAWRSRSAPLKTSDEPTVKTILRTNVDGLPQSARFDKIISYIEHSHDNTYPVVNQNSTVVGLIRYPLLSNVMFDHEVKDLICAEDLATPVDIFLYPDEPVSRASELFQKHSDDCIPVISREAPHPLIGVVRRSDVMHVLISQYRKG